MSVGKKIIIAVIALILLCIIGFLIITFPWWMLFLGTVFQPNPPSPEITYGEFPFYLEYQINEDVYIIEDILVCEFDGFENLGTGGKIRKWKEYVKSTGKGMISLQDLSNADDFTDWGTQVLELCFDPGCAEYYMNDPDSFLNRVPEYDWIDYLYLTPEGEKGYSGFKTDEAIERYNIRIIKWEYSKPIENTYK